MNRWITAALCSLLWGGTAYAACVGTIAASTPTTDFVDNGDGTVTHSKTGLMWKQCTEGLSGAGCATGAATKYTWQGALQAAQTLNNTGGFAGFTDWRVPNIKALNSIVENQCIAPSVNVTIFPATIGSWYWSASPYAGFATYAWVVGFNKGNDSVLNWLGSNWLGGGYVRLVRGGQ